MTDNTKTEILNQLSNNLDTFINRIGTEYPQKVITASLTSNDSLKSFEIKINEGRVIECIRTNQPINAISISKRTGITKSGISKIMGKLKKKGLINATHLTGNNKEIFYTLTAEGGVVANAHTQVYEDINRHYTEILQAYSEDDLNIINHFLQDMINAFF